MSRQIFILIFLFLILPIHGQDHDYLELHKAESQLERLFTELYSDTLTDPERVLREIEFLVPDALTMPGAMVYAWSRLSRIGVRSSDDQRIRIFSWHVMDDSDNYRYFCYIQIGLKKGRMELFSLQDNLISQRGVYRADQTMDSWYGKLYYGIVTKKVKR